MNDNIKMKASKEAYTKTRDYFLGESLKPTGDVPDLLAENRKIAISLAENVMSLVDVMPITLASPPWSLPWRRSPRFLSNWRRTASGSRRQHGHTWTSKGLSLWRTSAKAPMPTPPTLRCVAQEIQRRERRAHYVANDPLLKRIFGGIDGSGSTNDIPADESDGEGNGDTCEKENHHDQEIFDKPC